MRGILSDVSSALEASSDVFVVEHVLTGVVVDVTPFEAALRFEEENIRGIELEEKMLKLGSRQRAGVGGEPGSPGGNGFVRLTYA